MGFKSSINRMMVINEGDMYMKLNNGIKVISHPMPSLHSFTIGLYIAGGSRREPRDKRGITHLLEHMHFRHMRDMTQSELYYRMESMGSTLRAATYYEFMRYSMKARPQHFLGCADIIARVIETDGWTAEDVRAERAVVESQIVERGFEDSFEEMYRNCIYGDSELSRGIMGDVQSVRRITARDLAEYKRLLFAADNMLLCVTGCYSEAELERVRERIGRIPVEPHAVLTEPKRIRLGRRRPDVELCECGWERIDACLSFDVDYASVSLEQLQILNCILGEGVGSRLQCKIRESDGYTSEIYSEIDSFRDFAVLTVNFTVDVERFYDCLIEVLRVINGLKHDISGRDLDVTLPFYTENTVFAEDDSEQKNFDLAYVNFILALPNNALPSERTSQLDVLTSAAVRLFRPENACFSAAGNLDETDERMVTEALCGELSM